MRLTLFLFFLVAAAVIQPAWAAYITILGETLVKKGQPVSPLEPPLEGQTEEIQKNERKNGVYFPVTNNSVKRIDQIFGRVYGYSNEKPYAFRLVNNPHEAATRVTPGPHQPGKTAIYLFNVPNYRLRHEKYGLVVFDVSISFNR